MYCQQTRLIGLVIHTINGNKTLDPFILAVDTVM